MENLALKARMIIILSKMDIRSSFADKMGSEEERKAKTLQQKGLVIKKDAHAKVFSFILVSDSKAITQKISKTEN